MRIIPTADPRRLLRYRPPVRPLDDRPADGPTDPVRLGDDPAQAAVILVERGWLHLAIRRRPAR
jgi:hypothetical protein